MHTLQPDTATDGQSTETRRFRAETFDAAVALANAELGEHIDIVEANRIRRGGLGGFFATDLGVEIVVRPVASPERDPLPPVDGGSAIDRLLALVDAQERSAHVRTETPTDFGAALARELHSRPASAETTSDDWSVEAYRRLAIPAKAPVEERPADEPQVDAHADTDTDTDGEAQGEVPVEAPAAAPPAEPPVAAPAAVAVEASVESPVMVAARPAPAEPTPVARRTTPARPRRHNGRELAARLSQAAQAAAEQATEPVAAEHLAEPQAGEPAAASVAGDDTAQTMEMVTHAAATLFGQLGNMPVVADSQAAHVRKLTVSVNGPQGNVIEISAELGA